MLNRKRWKLVPWWSAALISHVSALSGRGLSASDLQKRDRFGSPEVETQKHIDLTTAIVHQRNHSYAVRLLLGATVCSSRSSPMLQDDACHPAANAHQDACSSHSPQCAASPSMESRWNTDVFKHTHKNGPSHRSSCWTSFT